MNDEAKKPGQEQAPVEEQEEQQERDAGELDDDDLDSVAGGSGDCIPTEEVTFVVT